MNEYIDPSDVDVFAKTLYGEARGEGLKGIEAVASVIINRLKVAVKRGDFWWGRTVKEICLKPYQFSCWNPEDLNFKKIREVTDKEPLFDVCLRVAKRAMLGFLTDTTRGATHYHAKSVHPAWARHLVPVEDIGNHLFYTEII